MPEVYDLVEDTHTCLSPPHSAVTASRLSFPQLTGTPSGAGGTQETASTAEPPSLPSGLQNP